MRKIKFNSIQYLRFKINCDKNNIFKNINEKKISFVKKKDC